MNLIWSLCWKEYREQRMLWLAIAVPALALVPILLAPADLVQHYLGVRGDVLSTLVLAVVLVLIASHGVFCGAMLLANERETRTEPFLDTLHATRDQIWRAKALAGLLMVCCNVTGMFVLSLLVDSPRDFLPRFVLFLLLLLLGLQCLACGLCASALMRSVLAAAGVAALLFFANFPVAILGAVAPPLLVAGHLLYSVATLVISRHVYCKSDRDRRDVVERHSKLSSLPKPWLASLGWLTWRQGKTQVLILCVCALVLAALFSFAGPWFWPAAALAIGLACGSEVFAQDQADGAYRFLGNQRFSAWQIWSVKVLFWLAMMTAALTVLFVLGSFGTLMRNLEEWGKISTRATTTLDILREKGTVSETIHAGLYLTVWPVYGFAVALILTQLSRGRFPALVLAGLISIALLAGWLPTLLVGGGSMWQLFALPLLLVALSAVSLRSWLTDRLSGWKIGLGVLLVTILTGGWLVGNLWLRATEVPDVGEPFDVAAYRDELAAAEKNSSTGELRQALSAMIDKQKAVTKKLGKPAGPLFPDQNKEAPAAAQPAGPDTEGREYDYHQLIEEARAKGWPKNETQLDRWLNEIFAGDWVDRLSMAARQPPGLLVDPRRTMVNSLLTDTDRCRAAAWLLMGRTLQLMAHGKDKEALDHIVTTLALSRHLRHHTESMSWLASFAVEKSALDEYEGWLARNKGNKELLASAVKALAQHDKECSPAHNIVKAEFFIFGSSLPQLIQEFKFPEYALAKQSPWEKARDERTLKLVFQKRFEFYQVPIHELRITAEADYEGKRIYLILPTGADRSAPGRASSDWDNFLKEEKWPTLIGIVDGRMRELNGSAQFDVRAAVIKTALALFEASEGHQATKLDQLTPKYLSVVPINPFSGQPFLREPPRIERQTMPNLPSARPVVF